MHMLPSLFLSLICMHRNTLSAMHLCLKMHTRAMYDSEHVFVNIYIYISCQPNSNNISPACSFLDGSFTYLCSSYFLCKTKNLWNYLPRLSQGHKSLSFWFCINSIHFIFAILDILESEAMPSFICFQQKHNGSRISSNCGQLLCQQHS